MDIVYYNDFGFSERTVDDFQPYVQNLTSRTVLNEELVYLNGFFGEVKKVDGIANLAWGPVNIFPFRTIQTNQIETTDTFVVAQMVYFFPGSDIVPGKLRSTNVTGSIPAGIVTEVGGTGGAHTYIVFRPFVQFGAQFQGISLKTLAVPIPIGSDTTPVVSTAFFVGGVIIDVIAIPSATSASGTVTISDGTNNITDAIAFDTINTIGHASTINSTYSTISSNGLTFTTAGATDEGMVYVIYI